jgi:hypothetical protein
MSEPPAHFEGPSDFDGSGSFRTIHGADMTAECCFFLPQTEIAKIWMLIRTTTQTLIAFSWKFSCKLRVEGLSLTADEVFHSGWTSWNWGAGDENSLIGEVTKLTIAQGDAQNSAITSVRFFLTPSSLLRSADIVSVQEGNVRIVKTARTGPKCAATENICFQFNSSYQADPSGRSRQSVHCDVVEPILIEQPTEAAEILDDVLTLAALAEGRNILVTGWEARYENGAHVKYYRRDFAAPQKDKVDIDDTLISLNNIEPFLNSSAKKLATLGSRNALKQAIHFTLSGHRPSIESSFMVLFSALETLLNVFRSLEDLETIIPKARWGRLRLEVCAMLAQDEAVRGLTPDRRTALENRVAQLNQISFPDAFRGMCGSYNIELGDLWPMLGAKEAGLYALRNRIVHGRLFTSDSEWFRLASAKYHLLWTLQRSVLAFLDWPLDRSRVSSHSLSLRTFYSSWRDDHQYFLSL